MVGEINLLVEVSAVDFSGMKKQAVVSPREAARMLGTRLDSVYGLIWAGRLQAEKRDGRWLISQSQVVTRARKNAERKNTSSDDPQVCNGLALSETDKSNQELLTQ